MNTITVVVVPGQEKPYSEEISNDLATFQKLVGGYIEVIAPKRGGFFLLT